MVSSGHSASHGIPGSSGKGLREGRLKAENELEREFVQRKGRETASVDPQVADRRTPRRSDRSRSPVRGSRGTRERSRNGRRISRDLPDRMGAAPLLENGRPSIFGWSPLAMLVNAFGSFVGSRHLAQRWWPQLAKQHVNQTSDIREDALHVHNDHGPNSPFSRNVRMNHGEGTVIGDSPPIILLSGPAGEYLRRLRYFDDDHRLKSDDGLHGNDEDPDDSDSASDSDSSVSDVVVGDNFTTSDSGAGLGDDDGPDNGGDASDSDSSASELRVEDNHTTSDRGTKGNDSHETELSTNHESLQADKARLSHTKARLVNSYAKGRGSRKLFRAELLDIIASYEEYARQKYCVPSDPDASKLNVLAFRVRKNGRELPYLRDIFDMEPQRGRQPWATDDLVKYLLQEISSLGLPHGQYLESNVSVVHFFANKLMTTKRQARKWFKDRIKDNREALDQDKPAHYIAQAMPPSCKVLHIWQSLVHLRLEVNHERTEGSVAVHDSLGGQSDDHRQARLLSDVRYICKIVSQRPALQWQNVEWLEPVFPACTQQANSDDCGPLAVETARRSIFGGEFYLPTDERSRLDFGLELRGTFYRNLASFLTGKRYPIVDVRAPGATSERETTATHRAVRTAILHSIEARGREASILHMFNSVSTMLRSVLGTEDAQRIAFLRILTNTRSYQPKDHPVSENDRFDAIEDFNFSIRQAPFFQKVPDSQVLRCLFDGQGTFEGLSNDIDHDFAIRIPVVRHSDWSRSRTGYELSVDRKRARDILHAHHARFSRCSTLPTEVDERFDTESLEQAMSAPGGCWMPYIRHPKTSSREAIFARGGTAGKDGVEVMCVLKKVAAVARARGQRLKVLFLFTAFDGITNSNPCWQQLTDTLPELDIHLTMASQNSCNPEAIYGRQDTDQPLAWMHYEVAYLASLYKSGTSRGFHLCDRGTVEATFSPFFADEQSGIDSDVAMLDPEVITCTECVYDGLLASKNKWCFPFAAAAAPTISGLRRYYSHAQFLVALKLIDDLKLDSSLFQRAERGRALAPVFNPSAAKLTGSQRNAFGLPAVNLQRCEDCDKEAKQFRRGSTSDVALHCLDCVSGTTPTTTETAGYEMASQEQIEPQVELEQDQAKRSARPNVGQDTNIRHRLRSKKTASSPSPDYPATSGDDSDLSDDDSLNDNGSEENHKATKTGNKKYQCHYCRQSYSKLPSLSKHERDKHQSQLPFPCPLCNLRFTAPRGRTCHMTLKHPGADG
ncbi:hypothetical protein LTR37_007592 [Vermiconidia calcicola]|uniref:Uncharacterized protein n=1 Tax=Vermiconidia calcicola TaxID=1690605 RepID=A0ACC3NEY9_9PEZI|nr:hypothetical protein LTR37_007592 [Vermiconidia calcicola]